MEEQEVKNDMIHYDEKSILQSIKVNPGDTLIIDQRNTINFIELPIHLTNKTFMSWITFIFSDQVISSCC